MAEVINPRRQQPPPTQSSDSPQQPAPPRERPRPPALKTSHSALRSVNRPPNVRRISNRVSIAEPEPASSPESEPEPEGELQAESSITNNGNQGTKTTTKPSPPKNLSSNPTIAHTATTLKIAQSLHTSLTSRLRVTTTPWASRNILTLDGGGIKGYSSLILLRSLMHEIALIESSLSPPAFSSADPTGNENYYFTEYDAFFYGPGTEMPDSELARKLKEGRVKVGDLKVDVPEEVVRRGEYLPAHYFDYIAGTSVGGLIAIMLGVLGRTVEGCLEEFKGSGRKEGGLPQLFVEMEDEFQEVDVGDGNHASKDRGEEKEKAERRRRVISFPGLGRLEIALFGNKEERERDKRRTTWPTKKSRAWFETFSRFSATSTDLTGTAAVSTTRAVASDTEEISPKTKRRETNGSTGTESYSRSSTTSSPSSSSISFKKNSFQCQTLAWCSEIDSDSPTERHPYAFCTYEEVLVAGDDSGDEGGEGEGGTSSSSHLKVPSIPEVAKAITTPSDSSQFKPFRLPAIGQFVDGSKEIRDPTLPVLKEISSLLGVDPAAPRGYYDPPIDLLLSLGTDEHNAWFYEKLVQPFTSSSTSSTSPSPSHSPQSHPPSPAEEELKSQKGRLYHHYRRFQVSPLSLSPTVVSTIPFLRRRNHLKEIEEATERWLSANNGEQRALLRKYAEMLVRKRRARSATTRWETFALGARYFCWVEGCGWNPDTYKGGKGGGKDREGMDEEEGEDEGEDEEETKKKEGFDTRGDFWDHLNDQHKMMKRAAKGEVLIEEWLDRGRRFGFL
ncbi:hypothetical protein B0T20DRAFT_404084 [Sordaria brevicollis]|uniref:PNPLA domain-containing protein n=1 Tax=Sordaria brevicollis TaxID=83679 RepID=A0AAE0PLY8_SORBR|nr:hypothetical protein B0T20DRAFT_404084 [Sordaria brevicollis]